MRSPVELSQSMLHEALQYGSITLGDGTIRSLKTAEILSIARFVLTQKALSAASMDAPVPQEVLEVALGEEES